jgi:hypothetical protein
MITGKTRRRNNYFKEFGVMTRRRQFALPHHSNTPLPSSTHFCFRFSGQGRAEVTLTRGRRDGDNQLAFVLGPFGHLNRRPDIGAG